MNPYKAQQQAQSDLIESITGVKFRPSKPSWLINSITGTKLGLDFYNDDLKIGIEFNGRQHYQFSTYIHRTMNNFIELQRLDKEKLRLCRENGVLLIVVPYTLFGARSNPETLRDYLQMKLNYCSLSTLAIKSCIIHKVNISKLPLVLRQARHNFPVK